MSKLKVIYVPVEGYPQEIEIEDELEPMHQLVGGYIEMVPFISPVPLRGNYLIVCNEEGKLLGLPTNIAIAGGLDYICGDCFVVRRAGPEFVSVSDAALEAVRQYVQENNLSTWRMCWEEAQGDLEDQFVELIIQGDALDQLKQFLNGLYGSQSASDSEEA